MSQEHQAGAKMSFTPARQKEEILKTAKSMRPDLTPEQLTELGKLYDKGARDQKMLSEIEKQSGSSMLGVAGVGADVFKEGIYNPASDMIGKVVGVPLNLATKVPVAGEYLEAGLHNLGKAMNAGEDWIGGKVAHITGSQTFADVTKELLMQATLAGVIGGAGKAVKAYTGAVKADVSAIRTGVQSMEFDAVNKAPYNPQKWDQHFQTTNPGETVTNHTVLRPNQPGASMAGKVHEKTNIYYTERGFAEFEASVTTEVRLDSSITAVKDRGTHMRAATRDLRDSIANGKITDSNLFQWQSKLYELKGESVTAVKIMEDVQILKQEIMSGKSKIGEFTWHHHQELGRMQLIPDFIHEGSRHSGGMSTWFDKELGVKK
jgi:hypothetical protein